MQFDEPKIIEALNSEWRWVLPAIDQILAVSSMGNVILRDDNKCYWRVCPEELSAEMFARSPAELQAAYDDPDRKADWLMSPLVSELIGEFGEPELGECFGMIIPGVLGGEYASSNIRRRGLYEYLRFTGDIGNQIKDVKNGEEVEFKLTD